MSWDWSRAENSNLKKQKTKKTHTFFLNLYFTLPSHHISTLHSTHKHTHTPAACFPKPAPASHLPAGQHSAGDHSAPVGGGVTGWRLRVN